MKNKTIKKAYEIVNQAKYEPYHTGYYPTLDGEDSGETYCENCIDSVVENLQKEEPNSTIEYENCDPDFSGGAETFLVCADCGSYFYTDLEPNLDECEYLYNEVVLCKEILDDLKWRIGIVFYNYDSCNIESKKVLLKIAKFILKL